MQKGDLIVLQGVVGSTAYGLAREGSDVDQMGVFTTPAMVIAGMEWTSHRESTVTNGPDATFHEVRKFLRLVMKGNPSVTEMLWLPEYVVSSPDGDLLLQLRTAISSTDAIYNAYCGYAYAQLTRLQGRGDGTFSSDVKNRTAKHGRHLLRLLRQAAGFMRTGRLEIRVDNPEEYWAFDNYDVDRITRIFEYERNSVNSAREASVLPDTPDAGLIRDTLDYIRLRPLM